MEQDKLNKKLAERAGFTWDGLVGRGRFRTEQWFYPGTAFAASLPNFPEDLSACFKWLVPKDYQQIIFQPDGYCGITIDDKLYEGSGETLAASFCSAIERLIDGS